MTPMKQPKAQMMYWLILTMVLPVQGMYLIGNHTLSCNHVRRVQPLHKCSRQF